MPLYNPPQPLDSDLTAIAALSTTAAGLALLDDADAAAQRTTLGLGTAAVKATGTSGDAVPVLNGAATTWAAGADHAGNILARGDLQWWGGFGQLTGYLTNNSGSGGIYMEALGTNQNIRLVPSGSGVVSVQGAGGIAADFARVTALRIDQAATAGVLVQSHSVTVSLNGVDYKLHATAA